MSAGRATSPCISVRDNGVGVNKVRPDDERDGQYQAALEYKTRAASLRPC
jgi:hypothetical protein